MKSDSAGLTQEELQALRERYEKLFSDNPSSTVFVFLAEVLRQQDNLDKATEVLIKGLAHNPGNVTGRLVLGKIYYDRWMIDAAKREMEEVIKLSPDNIAATGVLAEILRSEGKLDKALEICCSTKLFNPESAELRGMIADLEKEIGISQNRKSFRSQQEESSDLVEGGPDSLDAPDLEIYTETMADLYMDQGLYESAREIYEKLASSDPGNSNIRMKLDQARACLLAEKAGFQTSRQ